MKFRAVFFAGVFLSFFLFAFFLLQNLPFTFGDDLNIVRVAEMTPWGQLWAEFLNPFTQALYVHGLHCQLSTRVFQTILFKAFFALNGYDVNLFWFHKALAYAMCCSGIFLIVSRLTRQSYSGAYPALSFGLCSPVVLTTLWLADTEIVAQSFLVFSLYFFIRIVSSAPPKSTKMVLFELVSFFVLAWCAMKLKETARILPFVSLGYLVLTWQEKKVLTRGVWWALAIISVFLALSTIPGFREAEVIVDSHSQQVFEKLNADGFFIAVFRLFDLLFFPFLASVICFFVLWVKQSKRIFSSVLKAMTQPLFILLVLWCLFSMFGFFLGFNVEENPRYLTTPLVPLSITVFVVLVRLSDRVIQVIPSLWIRNLMPFILLFTCLFQGFPAGPSGFLTFKLDEVLYARNFWGGTDIAIHKLAKFVYADYFKEANPSWRDLHDFFHQNKDQFSGMQLKDWDVNQRFDSSEISQSLKMWGAVYVYSFSPDFSSRYPRFQKVMEDTTHNHSFYADIISKIKKKALRKFYLYKAVDLPTS